MLKSKDNRREGSIEKKYFISFIFFVFIYFIYLNEVDLVGCDDVVDIICGIHTPIYAQLNFLLIIFSLFLLPSFPVYYYRYYYHRKINERNIINQ